MIKTQAFKIEPEIKIPELNVLLKTGCYNMLDKVIHTGGCTGCVRKNSGILAINIYSLLWDKNFLLTRTSKQSDQVLLTFIAILCQHQWWPYRKQNPNLPNTQDRASRGTTAIAAVILQCKFGRETTHSLYMVSLTYPQKNNPMGVKLWPYVGQLFGLPLLIYRPGNCLFREANTVAQKWAGAPSCWTVRPSTSATICGSTKFSNTAR